EISTVTFQVVRPPSTAPRFTDFRPRAISCGCDERSAPRANRRVQAAAAISDPLTTRLERKIDGCNGGLEGDQANGSSTRRTHKYGGSELLTANKTREPRRIVQARIWRREIHYEARIRPLSGGGHRHCHRGLVFETRAPPRSVNR